MMFTGSAGADASYRPRPPMHGAVRFTVHPITMHNLWLPTSELAAVQLPLLSGEWVNAVVLFVVVKGGATVTCDW